MAEPLSDDVRLRNLAGRLRWSGWKIVPCGPAAYALVRLGYEAARWPDYGTVDLSELERFADARDREPVF